MHGNEGSGDEPGLVSNRTMDIVVALLLLLVSSIVIYDSTRLGFDWRENEGPASGYFPFYIAVILAGASVVNLARAVLAKGGNGSDAFVTKTAFMRVLAVLVPAIVYVGAIQYLGLTCHRQFSSWPLCWSWGVNQSSEQRLLASLFLCFYS